MMRPWAVGLFFMVMPLLSRRMREGLKEFGGIGAFSRWNRG